MARRTRRPKVVWLPVDRDNRLGEPSAATVGTASSHFQFQIAPPDGAIGSTGSGAIPLVGDSPQINALAGSSVASLADFEGSAYRLRRVVGKIYAAISQVDLGAGAADTMILTVGLIVLRCDPEGIPLVNVANVVTAVHYNPSAMDNISDPWIWRRSWMLTNAVQVVANSPFHAIFPPTNASGFGSGISDGPHVDAKTARIIGNEERLFLVATATNANGDGQPVNDIILTGDLRVLASMRSSQGNRRNASR